MLDRPQTITSVTHKIQAFKQQGVKIILVSQIKLMVFEAIKHKEIHFWILLAITVYVPFEEFLLKWIPGPDIIPLLMRFIPEIILYAIFFQIFKEGLFGRRKLRNTPIEKILIIFIIWGILLVFLNKSSIFSSINNMRSLLRYVAVYYIVINIKPSQKQVLLFLKSIIFISLLEGTIVLAQYFGGPSINSIFAPRDLNVQAGNIQIERVSEVGGGTTKVGSVGGTFSTTASTASFFLVSLAILFSLAYLNSNNPIPKVKYLASILLFYFGVFAPYKRMALILATTIPILVFIYLGKKKNVIFLLWSYMTIAFIALFVLILVQGGIDTSVAGGELRSGKESYSIGYLLQIFTPEYFERATEHSRGWIIKVICQGIFGSGYWFGLSPDPKSAANKLAELTVNAGDKIQIIEMTGLFEDVYWAAMLLYYGIPGLIYYMLILQRLYQSAQFLIKFSSEPTDRWIGVTFSTVMMMALSYGFATRIFELKAFSFYFWLLAGLTINACYNSRKLNRLPVRRGLQQKSLPDQPKTP